MRISTIAFTDGGLELASRIAAALEAEGERVDVARGFGEGKANHGEWTAERFGTSDALLFVGALGICVRSIAPHLASKATDPAVICIDEGSRFCIPVLSGHIGGANQLAQRIARFCGATPVVTTATDVRGVFAIDSWAVSQGLAVANPQAIKEISSALLAGGSVSYASELPISGNAPQGLVEAGSPGAASIFIGNQAPEGALHLIPRAYILGIGCRRGTSREAIEAAAMRFLAENAIDPLSIAFIASIDLKANEEGLLAFAAARRLELVTFDSDTLNAQEGDFSSSGFVKGVTGTDNVCARAAVAAGGELVIGKTVVDGMTFALSKRSLKLAWQ
ncbi:MAG: cobalamin biosynthesis protein [Coriobacteriales bacterium]|nr:cobalamin biosynthesis protein [Coriobacteriales bacterium]